METITSRAEWEGAHNVPSLVLGWVLVACCMFIARPQGFDAYILVQRVYVLFPAFIHELTRYENRNNKNPGEKGNVLT